MNWLRTRLRAWLGIEDIDQARAYTLKRVSSIAGDVELGKERQEWLRERVLKLESLPTLADVSRKQFEIDQSIRELKELKQAIADPKHRPVVTRTMREYRALMEQE